MLNKSAHTIPASLRDTSMYGLCDMKNYKVSYTGLPSSKTEISAANPKLAALKFFSQSPCRNSIFVESDWFKEELFTCEEMIGEIDGIAIEDIPLKIRKDDPPKKIGLIEEFLNHAILGKFHSWK